MTALTLQATKVTHAFGSDKVLDGASFEARPGEMTVVVGPNGAGKTTLLRVLAGVLRPEQGTVTLEDRNVLDVPRRQLAKRLTFIPQAISVPPDQSVEDFVLLGRYAHTSAWRGYGPEDLKHLETALGHMDLSPLRQRLTSTLSGGEVQRTVLARAIAQNTDFVLLDEPANNLDPAHIWRTFEVLRQLVDAGRGIVLIVHDLQLACRYADSIAMVFGGTVRQGSPEQIITEKAIAECFGMKAEVSLEPPARVEFIRAIGPSEGTHS